MKKITSDFPEGEVVVGYLISVEEWKILERVLEAKLLFFTEEGGHVGIKLVGHG